jgi:hypothetical protein
MNVSVLSSSLLHAVKTNAPNVRAKNTLFFILVGFKLQGEDVAN